MDSPGGPSSNRRYSITGVLRRRVIMNFTSKGPAEAKSTITLRRIHLIRRPYAKRRGRRETMFDCPLSKTVKILDQRSCRNVLNLKGIFVNGTMKPAGSRAVVAPTMAGMMEEVTDCGSSCRIHIFRRVPRAAATCLISARVELPSLHPPPHGLPLAAAAARPGPATSTTLRSLLQSLEI